jgi:peptidoglycan/LPS O-acetylase OafA/YrhL
MVITAESPATAKGGETSEKNVQPERGRILPLDGLRGIAVAVVILFHYLNNQYASANPAELNSIERLLMKATGLGWAGVNLFFILSGFLIGSILLKNKGSKNFFKVFYTRRFLRIIPVYYVLLVLFIILKNTSLYHPTAAMFEYDIPGGYYFLFLQNFIMSSHGNFGPQVLTPTWSLAVEEQFYLLIPLVVYFFNKRGLQLFIGICLVAAPVCRYFTGNWYAEYTLISSRIDSPVFGFLLAYLLSFDSFKTYLRNNMRKVTWYLTAIVLACGGIYAFTSLGVLNHTILGVIFAVVVLKVLFLEDGFLYRVLTSRQLLQLGKYSYCIYLFHQLFNFVLHMILLDQNIPVLNDKWAYGVTLLAGIATFAFSKLSFRFLEGPLTRFGHSFKYR